MISSSFSGPDCHTERSGRLREQFEGPAPDQPSIVTYLLLQRPVSLQDWPGHVHRIETPEDFEFERSTGKRLLALMREQGAWHCEAGPSTFYRWWNRRPNAGGKRSDD